MKVIETEKLNYIKYSAYSVSTQFVVWLEHIIYMYMSLCSDVSLFLTSKSIFSSRSPFPAPSPLFFPIKGICKCPDALTKNKAILVHDKVMIK